MSASVSNGSHFRKASRLAALVIFALGIILLPSFLQRVFPPALPVLMLSLHEVPRSLPRLEFQDSVGRNLTLENFRGSFILLNVWATWCPPCKQEMPSVNRLVSYFSADDLKILPLSIDVSGVPAVRYFYKSMHLDKLLIYVDPSTKAMQVLSASGIPATVLINRDGLEIGRVIGATKWDAPEIIDQLSKAMGIAATAVGREPPVDNVRQTAPAR